jgi:bifunctional DNA-binding transcriptional regulator/antitoxin component of YhaV-PrlF toxin-antitoxin module
MRFCITINPGEWEEINVAVLTVTSRGQVTFRKEVLQHLGIRPGEKIEIELLPGARVAIRAPEKPATFKDIEGFLQGKTNGAVLTLEQIDEAIRSAGAEVGTAQ